MPMAVWPTPSIVVGEFYTVQMSIPLDLWRAFEITTPGSQRPTGPRRLQWIATQLLAVSALEAGLEDLLIAAHGHRAGRTGHASLARDTRRHLVEDPLQAPSARKIKQLLFSSFGIELASLPVDAQFEARRKVSPNTGDGKGTRVGGPSTWAGLKEYLAALMHIRNGAAHGDVVKLGTLPATAEGLLWVKRSDGRWSVQQPHALTALRTVIATYNTVALALEAKLRMFGPSSPIRNANSGTTDAAVGHVGAQGRVGASPVRSSMTMVMKP